MFVKKCCKCCECNCHKENGHEENNVEITAKDYFDGWIKNNDIRIRLMRPGKMTKLLAIRLCNAILKEAGIDFELSALHFSNR